MGKPYPYKQNPIPETKFNSEEERTEFIKSATAKYAAALAEQDKELSQQLTPEEEQEAYEIAMAANTPQPEPKQKFRFIGGID